MKKQLTYKQNLLVVLVFLLSLNLYSFSREHSETGEREDPREPGTGFFKPFTSPLQALENNFFDARFILGIKEEIALTQEQEEKIENLMLQNEANTIRQSAEIKILELRFTTFLKSQVNKIDRKQVEKYIREISEMKTTMIVHHMNYLLDVKQSLTPIQLKKLSESRK
ncbi:MAG: Spy/CpxP family protein refolding chaperone [Acidobacteria bacterium]|nr:Spy/CpxP family protein refolding chaperone [Acidobacteriota bacterium]